MGVKPSALASVEVQVRCAAAFGARSILVLKEATMLPVFFQNIPYYKIDDLFTFSGDLIITSGILYYFPNTDLEQERIYRGGEAEAGLLGFEALGDLFTKVLANFELSQTTTP